MDQKSTINNILNPTDNSKNIGVEINDNINSNINILNFINYIDKEILKDIYNNQLYFMQCVENKLNPLPPYENNIENTNNTNSDDTDDNDSDDTDNNDSDDTDNNDYDDTDNNDSDENEEIIDYL